jgi:putative transposase
MLRSPFSPEVVGELPYRPPLSASVVAPVDLGVAMDGDPLLFRLAGLMLLMVADSGGGKSGVMLAMAEAVTACRDAVVFNVDPVGTGVGSLGEAITLSACSVRGRAAPPQTTGPRQVAPRRGLHQDQRGAALPVAGRRQGRNVLDILVQSKRDAKAAKRFLAKLMNKQRRVPRVLVTDKLRSYGVAHRELMRSIEHRSHKGLNNQAENSHQPTRQRERAMKYFRSPRAAQKFVAVFSQISPNFRPRRHLMTATDYRAEMTTRFAIRHRVTGVTAPPTAS